jgi:hypothetical protein
MVIVVCFTHSTTNQKERKMIKSMISSTDETQDQIERLYRTPTRLSVNGLKIHVNASGNNAEIDAFDRIFTSTMETMANHNTAEETLGKGQQEDFTRVDSQYQTERRQRQERFEGSLQYNSTQRQLKEKRLENAENKAQRELNIERKELQLIRKKEKKVKAKYKRKLQEDTHTE